MEVSKERAASVRQRGRAEADQGSSSWALVNGRTPWIPSLRIRAISSANMVVDSGEWLMLGIDRESETKTAGWGVELARGVMTRVED